MTPGTAIIANKYVTLLGNVRTYPGHLFLLLLLQGQRPQGWMGLPRTKPMVLCVQHARNLVTWRRNAGQPIRSYSLLSF